MALTIEDVVNNALDSIGAPRIQSLYDTSAAAKVALDIWQRTRDEVFLEYKPYWAKKTALLAVVKTAPPEYNTGVPWTVAYPEIPWKYEYTLPTDCLLPLQLVREPQAALTDWRVRPIRFRAKALTLLTDEVPANLFYLYRELDLSVWRPGTVALVVEALAKKFVAQPSLLPEEPRNAVNSSYRPVQQSPARMRPAPDQ